MPPLKRCRLGGPLLTRVIACTQLTCPRQRAQKETVADCSGNVSGYLERLTSLGNRPPQKPQDGRGGRGCERPAATVPCTGCARRETAAGPRPVPMSQCKYLRRYVRSLREKSAARTERPVTRTRNVLGLYDRYERLATEVDRLAEMVGERALAARPEKKDRCRIRPQVYTSRVELYIAGT